MVFLKLGEMIVNRTPIVMVMATVGVNTDDESDIDHIAAILCKYTWKPLLENMTDCQSLINIQLQMRTLLAN